MANQIIKYEGKQEQNIQTDLLYSILQNTGTGGGFDFNLLNKEETQVLVSQILQSLVIAVQATNTQLSSNIISEVNAINLTAKETTQLNVLSQINSLITQVVNLRTSNTSENGLIAKEATLSLINTNIGYLKNCQVINRYIVANANLIVSTGALNNANTYVGSRSKMIARVISGSYTIVAGNPAGALFQFRQSSNQFNLQTVLTPGIWICDFVPDYFSIISGGVGSSIELNLHP